MAGSMLETWVYNELRKLLSLQRDAVEMSVWRSHDEREVDFVIERGGEEVGIEVESAPAFACDANVG